MTRRKLRDQVIDILLVVGPLMWFVLGVHFTVSAVRTEFRSVAELLYWPFWWFYLPVRAIRDLVFGEGNYWTQRMILLGLIIAQNLAIWYGARWYIARRKATHEI